MDTQGLRDVNERLKPLRRMLDDLQAATEAVIAADVRKAEQEAMLQRYDEQIAAQQETLRALFIRHQDVTDEYERDALLNEQAREEMRLQLVAYRENLDKQQVQLEYENAQVRTAMDVEHRQYIAKLAAEKAAADADVQRVKKALALLRQQVTG